MIYETTAQFTKADKKGNGKTFKEQVIVDGLDTFTEVEARMYSEYNGQCDLDVIAIKRSRLKEIANKRENLDDRIFIADLCDTFIDDNDNEKETIYKIAFFSQSIDKAKNFIDQYIKQGYDMKLRGLKESKFVDVI